MFTGFPQTLNMIHYSTVSIFLLFLRKGIEAWLKRINLGLNRSTSLPSETLKNILCSSFFIFKCSHDAVFKLGVEMG